jgi:hypothetical protein
MEESFIILSLPWRLHLEEGKIKPMSMKQTVINARHFIIKSYIVDIELFAIGT